jgi:hypothetical protein
MKRVILPVYVQKHIKMVGTAIMGGLQLGSQIFSAIKNAKQQKMIDRDIRNEQQHNEAMRGLTVSRDFADTNAAKSMFEKVRSNQLEANKNVENRQEILGGTPEAEIAAKSQIQQDTNQAVNSMTGQATDYQQGQDRMYENTRKNLYDDTTNQREKKIDSALNLHENASNLMNSAGFMDALNTAPKNTVPSSGVNTGGSLAANTAKSLGLKITVPKSKY